MRHSDILKDIIIRISNALIEAVFPSVCPVCGSFFLMPESRYIHHTFISVIPEGYSPETITFEAVMRQYLCPECLSGTFIQAESPVCFRCGMIFRKKEGEDRLCSRCLKNPPKFGSARSFGVYDGIFRECIHAFKYREKIWLRKPFGIFLFSAFLRNWNPRDIDIIIPVPLHVGKMRSRGFNQVYMMLMDWNRIAEIFHTDISHIRIEKEGLIRIRETETQVGMTMEERMTNLSNAFRVTRPEKIAGKKILLADDVITTGTTANKCAEVLLNEGKACRVDVLTLAKTLLKKTDS